MRCGVLPKTRPLNVNPLHAISEVSYEDHVGEFLRLARRNPQRIYSGEWNYQCSVLQSCNGKAPNRIPRVRPGICESRDWFLLHDNAPYHNAIIVNQFLAQRKVNVLDRPPYSRDLAPADYLLFPKVKSHWKGHVFDSISDIQRAVTDTLNTIAKDDFYKGIQKLYDPANLCVQLEGMYVEN